MALPGWTKGYQDIGLAAIPPAIVSQLRLAQVRYGQYADMFKMLTTFYEGRSGISKRLVSAMEASRSVSSSIGLLLGSRGRTATPEEIQNMYDLMTRVDAEVKYIGNYAGESTRFSKILEETEAKTNVSLSHIQKTNEQMNKKLKNLGKMGLGRMANSLKQNAPELAMYGSGIKNALLNSTLGPFAGLAKSAVGTVSGIYKGIQQKRREKDQMKIMTELNPMLKLQPEELLRSVEAERTRGSNLKSGLGESDIRGMKSGIKSPRAEAEPKGIFTEAFSSKPTDLKNMAMPLFTFFDKKAYDAKWTKEVVELLRKISKTSLDTSKNKIGGSGGLLGGILGGMGLRSLIGPIVSTALAVLGVASVAALAGLVFSILKPKIGKTAAATVAAGPGAGLSMLGADLTSSFFGKGEDGKMKGFRGVKDMMAEKTNFLKSSVDSFFHRNKKKEPERIRSSETTLPTIEFNSKDLSQMNDQFKSSMKQARENLPKEIQDRMPMMEEQMGKLEKIGPQIQQSIVDSGIVDSLKKMFSGMEKSLAGLKAPIQTSPHQRRSSKNSVWNLGDPLTENINSGELNQRE